MHFYKRNEVFSMKESSDKRRNSFFWLLVFLVLILVIIFIVLGLRSCGFERDNNLPDSSELFSETTLETSSNGEQSGSSSLESESSVIVLEEPYVFGNYFSEEDPNQKSPVEWLVYQYDYELNRALMISKYIIDIIPYHDKAESFNWETCFLREWLNKEFFESAFTAEEQSRVLVVELDNSYINEQDGTTVGGEKTMDSIFILSMRDITRDDRDFAWSQFQNHSSIKPGLMLYTPYSAKKGGYGGLWWLRAASDRWGRVHIYNTLNAEDPSDNIHNSTVGQNADNAVIGVRPCFWLNLKDNP